MSSDPDNQTLSASTDENVHGIRFDHHSPYSPIPNRFGDNLSEETREYVPGYPGLAENGGESDVNAETESPSEKFYIRGLKRMERNILHEWNLEVVVSALVVVTVLLFIESMGVDVYHQVKINRLYSQNEKHQNDMQDSYRKLEEKILDLQYQISGFAERKRQGRAIYEMLQCWSATDLTHSLSEFSSSHPKYCFFPIFSEQKVTWSEAIEQCPINGGFLASPVDDYQLYRISKLVTKAKSLAYFGLRHNATTATYQDIHGRNVSTDLVGGHMDTTEKLSGACVAATTCEFPRFLKHIDCDTRLPVVICEVPL